MDNLEDAFARKKEHLESIDHMINAIGEYKEDITAIIVSFEVDDKKDTLTNSYYSGGINSTMGLCVGVLETLKQNKKDAN